MGALCAAAERNGTSRYAMAGTVLGVNDVGPMLLYTDADDMDPRPRCLTGEDLPGLIFTEGPGIIRSKNYELHVGQKNTDPIDMWKKGGGYQEAENCAARPNAPLGCSAPCLALLIFQWLRRNFG